MKARVVVKSFIQGARRYPGDVIEVEKLDARMEAVEEPEKQESVKDSKSPRK